jgi:Calcium-dependent channel, 7TM region, putative phosphate
MSRMAATYRQKKKLWANNWFMYGPDIPGHTITLLLMLVFAVVQPLLPLVCLAYFVVSYIFARYDLLYTNREAYQTGGLLWPVVCMPHAPQRCPLCL